MEIICTYNTQHKLDDTVSRMLNEAYLNNPENATIFMAEHLLGLCGSNVEKHSKNLTKKLKEQCSIYAYKVEEEKRKKLEMEGKIEELEKQLRSQELTEKDEKVETEVIAIPQNFVDKIVQAKKKFKKEDSELAVIVYPTISAPAVQNLHIKLEGI